VSRDTQHVLLVLVGGVLVKIVLDGSYLRYVRPWSAVPVLLAGVVLVTVAVVGIVRDARGSSSGHHEHGAGPSAWMLVLPVLALLLVVPPALGSAAVGGDGGVGARAAPVAAVADEPLPAGDAPALGLLDVVSRAATDPFGPLTTRDVTLTGFLVPARAAPPGAGPVDLARLVITCCAADASSVRVHLADPQGLLRDVGPGGPEGDRWVAVRGRVVAGTGTPGDGHVPTLTVTGWSPVATPEPVYEY
jgi:uncharacterized repeat protein (TIGR03943 family)